MALEPRLERERGRGKASAKPNILWDNNRQRGRRERAVFVNRLHLLLLPFFLFTLSCIPSVYDLREGEGGQNSSQN